jgi:hypothetical protein
MDLFFNLDLCERGLARGIYDSLREAILDGRLAPNGAGTNLFIMDNPRHDPTLFREARAL